MNRFALALESVGLVYSSYYEAVCSYEGILIIFTLSVFCIYKIKCELLQSSSAQRHFKNQSKWKVKTLLCSRRCERVHAAFHDPVLMFLHYLLALIKTSQLNVALM